MPTYATTTQYATAYPTEEPPANLTQFLDIASRAVRRATIAAIYDTDEAGAPTDTTVAAAFRDATIAHTRAMIAAGIIDPAAGPAGFTGGTVSASIGRASVTRTARSGIDRDRVALFTGLAPNALSVLADAGLTSTVATW